MKEIKLEDLPLVLTEKEVKVLMEMAWEQTPEWVKIWESWSYEKKEEFSELKSKISSEKFKKELEYKKLNQTQEEWDEEQLAYWGMYVDRERHYTDYTIEDMIEMTLNKDFFTRDIPDLS